MIRLITLLIIGLSFFASYAQDSKSTSRENLDYEADKIAKEATTNILNYIGLPPDFKVVQLDIPNVIAYTYDLPHGHRGQHHQHHHHHHHGHHHHHHGHHHNQLVLCK